MPATPETLFAFLDTLGIETTTVTHPPLFTVEDSRRLRGTIPGAHTKNLFLKDKKGALWLVTCREDRRIRIRDLEKAIGASKTSFGKPELMLETLGITPGAVTVFALINDREAQRVRVALDRQLMEMSPINAHPLHNEATTAISRENLLRFVEACGHDPVMVDFDALEALEAARDADKG